MEHILDKEKLSQKTTPPKMWQVVFHNDDFSSFDLVIYVMEAVFNKTREQATKFAMDVHQQGKGIAGTYTKEIAETKQQYAMDIASQEEMPLLITLQAA